jgi:5-methylcytosine-specific restriction endonuclease McrA
MAPDDRSLEHIVDWADGGRNDRANLVLAHAACNHAAQGLTVDEKMLRHGDALLARLAAEMRVAA